MKKNVMMRVASALLVAVLMTTCAISGTFAKYTTTDSTALETARVAKWGVNVDAMGETAFKTNYEEGDVVSQTSNKVVAPGTEGVLGGITISGQPEVKVSVSVDATVTLTGWTVDGVDYCPIVFTVVVDNDTENPTVLQQGAQTAEQFAAAVEAAIENVFSVGTVNAGVSLNKSVSVSWAWAFEGNDVNDTKLGNLNPAPTISFQCSAGVTQIGD